MSSFNSPQRATLSLKYLIDVTENPLGTLILAHGAGAPMDSDFMNHLTDELNQAGVCVVRFEFPYMSQRREGGKKRPPNRAPILLEYFTGVIEDIARRDDLPKPLLIGGKSMGGRIASMLADHSKVKGVCCFGYPFCPPGKPEKLDERTLHLRPQPLTASNTPIRIFQGTRDPFGKPDLISPIQFRQAVCIEWLEDGDHDLKSRKSSGINQSQLLQVLSAQVASLCDELLNLSP